MTLTEIFADEEKQPSEKLNTIKDIVATARTRYGNTDVSIEEPLVYGVNGGRKLSLYNLEDKLTLAKYQVDSCITEAINTVDANEALILDKEIERLLATNPILCNLTIETGSEYI